MSDQNSENIKYYKIAKQVDIPDGERLFFELEGKAIVLFSLNGEYAALDDICTHDQGPIGEGELDGDVIVCPRHGARFDVHTGKVLSFPAVENIQAYPVRINEDFIEVGISQ